MKLLRDLLAVGLIWGILWAALAMIVGTIIGFIDPDQIDPGEEPLVLAPMIGLVGFICGVAFGALLSIAERRKPFLDPPLIRGTMWGILVAAALPLVAGKDIGNMLVTVPVGAVSALVSLAIARKWTALPITRN